MVRRASIVSGLAALVAVALASASAGQSPGPGAGPPGGTPPGLDKAIAAKEKHAEKLLDQPGIAGIGVGLNPAGKPVIRIYKEKSVVADVPAELEGVPVQSVTTGILQARAPSDRFDRPVPIGVSSGHYEMATGTLGARVTDGTNVYALSNNHVFAGINSASIGDPILQPGPIEDGGALPDDQIGTLHDYQEIDFAGNPNTMDAAVALVSTGTVGTATPPDGYGTPSPVTAPASIGLAVQKYGRTTGQQLGTVSEIDVTVDVCYLLFFDICLQEAQFVNQITVSPGTFSAPGDSGSLIVTQGGNQPVALLFAGGDGLTVGSPIDAVLQRFGVTIDGSTPPDGPPGAPTSLAASPGDASASLSWSAPSFTGGSPVTGYRVYRGTSPNPTTALTPDLGVQTTYADTGLVNGTTYYYKVSALNANGEGPLSGQAQATPTAVVPPSAPLAIVDNFDDGFENPLSDQGRWANGVSGGEVGLYVPSVWLACSIGTTCTGWRKFDQYGPDSEVYARLSVLPGDSNQLRLYARLQQPGTSTYDAYMLRTTQLSGTDQVALERVDNGTIVTLLTINQELVAGDLLLLRVQGQVLEAWLNRSGWSRIGVVADATYGAAGYVGIGLRGTTGRADDFGARTLGAPPPPPDTTPPSAPGTLTASAFSSTQIDLAWGAATDNSGTVAQYLIERCSGSPCTFAQVATVGGATTSYSNTGLSPSTAYSYRVRAQDGAAVPNVGPYSNTATATPAPPSVTPPSAPLPTVDDFNRGFENPLADPGPPSGLPRWSNGVSGGEVGLYVPSTWLACSISTTCSAWRNTGQFGPDTEVWARLSVLPGDTNQLRLLARVQQPGTPGYDGYMLRTTQLAGTDQVALERVDNGTIVTLLTVNQELVAGDLLLLRVQGQMLEAWRNNGSWSRIGAVADATYGGAGYTGIGLRNTTGRADDFGARTLGAPPPPPDTTPPSAPGTLTASAFSSTQIDLAWGAATDNSGTVAQYLIERCSGSPCTFAQVATVGGATTSYSNTGLSPSTAYSYRVRAQDGAPVPNVGPYSNTATATTPAPPDTTPPSAPGTLTASAFSSTQIDLAWGAATDNSGTVAQYLIERCSGSPCTFAQVATVGGATTSYSNTGLSPSTAYSYRVRAQDGAPVPNVGPYSNTATATTPAPPDTTPPSAPGTLTASAFSSTQIDLAWGAATDNSGTVAQYLIERCSGSPCTFAQVATVGGATTSYSNTGLSPSTAYSYRVRAQDGAPVPNVGPYSNTATATTPAPPDTTPPSAPGTLTASAFSSTQIDLAWGAATDNSGTVAQYLIERCSGSPCTFAQVATVGGATTSYSNTGLSPSTAYSYRVRAQDGAPVPNVGPYSNTASASTQAAPRPLYFSLLSDGTVGGLSVANEDVVFFDGITTFGLAFDGSDVGLTSFRIDAFSWVSATSLLLSFDTAGAIPGIGTVDDSDLVLFTATSLGTTTAGTFTLYFDGSDVGLTTNAEDVDAAELLPNGHILISTTAAVSVPGFSGDDKDLLEFTPTSLGAVTAGTFSLYFDGSDVGLATSAENIDAAAVDASGRIYLSTVGNFSVPGISGGDEDVFVFTPAMLGTNTTGTYSATLYFDGSAFGLAANDVYAIDLPAGT